MVSPNQDPAHSCFMDKDIMTTLLHKIPTAKPPKITGGQRPAAKRKIGQDILVAAIIDMSGSMAVVRDETISGFNEYINTLRSNPATRYSVTLTLFDSEAITTLYNDLSIDRIQVLTAEQYRPNALTPLYDAIASTIRTAEDAQDGRPVICFIMTDGFENASTEFPGESGRLRIKELIARKERDGWTFIFTGANIDAYAAAAGLGINYNKTMSYGYHSTVPLFATMGMHTNSYSANRTATQTMSATPDEAFFTATDRANLGDKSPTSTTGLTALERLKRAANVPTSRT